LVCHASELTCLACPARFPIVDGVLDLLDNPAGQYRTPDRPYEGWSGRGYGWFMDHPFCQRLDGWLLGMNTARYYDEMIRRLGAQPDGPTLEMPCGGAPFLSRSGKYRRGGPWIFVDLSRTLLHRVVVKVNRLGLTRHVIIRADARSLPIRDGVLTNVVSMFGFHCFHDKDTVFAEISRCLQPAGRALVSTLVSDGPRLSRLYHWMNQRDGTFARDNSAQQILSHAEAHALTVAEPTYLGSAVVFTAHMRRPNGAGSPVTFTE
jgi:ubiquinone/menaquinone biosynthesis C-methylase UbiE